MHTKSVLGNFLAITTFKLTRVLLVDYALFNIISPPNYPAEWRISLCGFAIKTGRGRINRINT